MVAISKRGLGSSQVPVIITLISPRDHPLHTPHSVGRRRRGAGVLPPAAGAQPLPAAAGGGAPGPGGPRAGRPPRRGATAGAALSGPRQAVTAVRGSSMKTLRLHEPPSKYKQLVLIFGLPKIWPQGLLLFGYLGIWVSAENRPKDCLYLGVALRGGLPILGGGKLYFFFK